VVYATTHSDYAKDIQRDGPVGPELFRTIPDANRDDWIGLTRQICAVARILLRVRPDVVISTGASAGYFALRFGKLLKCRTVWVDSIANAEQLSLAGRRVQPYADLWLTQWPGLAHESENGKPAPRYEGAVL
jgi:UDP-N-acetylglucosamine:LPS N-acetylglucosamine transferase